VLLSSLNNRYEMINCETEIYVLVNEKSNKFLFYRKLIKVFDFDGNVIESDKDIKHIPFFLF
jgi:hypothetical protein